jgi:hypothetical protein
MTASDEVGQRHRNMRRHRGARPCAIPSLAGANRRLYTWGDALRSNNHQEDCRMAVDGTWNLTMETPMGERKTTLEAKTEGGTLTGQQSAEGNSTAIYDGTVTGNDVAWKVDISQPMELTLEFAGAVDGDTMTGSVKLGMFGTAPFTAARG